jgi:RNA polymerase sigma factor (sigma-70 family)
MTPEDARTIEELIPNLRRYARALVRDPDLADDLVQDCLERAISRFHHFEPGTNLRGWLFTILLNIVRSHTRSAKWRNQALPLDELNSRATVPGNQDAWLTMRDLQRAFDELSPSFREVLMIVAVEGLSYEDAAGIIGTPIGTVRSRLSRARAQLKEGLEGIAAPQAGMPTRLDAIDPEADAGFLERMMRLRDAIA